MAYSFIWPLSLPQAPLANYSESTGVLILRTKPDAGPAKMRRRGKRPDILNVQYNMSSDQVNTFRSFVEDSLQGTTRFGYPHPRTNDIVEVRIIPQGDGGLYSLSYLLPDYWQVSMQLEVLP